MRKLTFLLLAAAGVTLLVVFAGRLSPGSGNASSHREAPLIADDPTADNTDLYAFRSADKPNALTVISNWIPAEDPAAGPNYYTFSPTARYNIYLDRNGDGKPDVTYRFNFTRAPGSLFLGNTVQSYTVTKIADGHSTVIGHDLMTPPDNIGPRSTPNYRSLAAAAVYKLDDGSTVFAGQRDDAFFADIGAIFDLVAIRKGIGNQGGGKDFFAGYGVHGIALQIPIAQIDTASHVVGVWSATDRQPISVEATGSAKKARKTKSAWVQVSRLGNPLFNEVIVPTTLKDRWNRLTPADDSQFAQYVREPILAKVLNQLYNLGVKETDRNDLVQVLLTGVPKLNFTGNTLADELRINLSIPPTTDPHKFSRLGVLGGDLAGYPNGRRLEDDVVDIDEQAVAGALIQPSTPPLGDGVDKGDVPNLSSFPYEADPFSGFDNTKGVPQP
jgi:uncharacterized protein DUF4331